MEKNNTMAQELIEQECYHVRDLLLEKNRKYGDSALSPLRVFSRADAVEGIKIRIDDKLSRIISSQDDDIEDTCMDLIGYLILLRVAVRRDWIASTFCASDQARAAAMAAPSMVVDPEDDWDPADDPDPQPMDIQDIDAILRDAHRVDARQRVVGAADTLGVIPDQEQQQRRIEDLGFLARHGNRHRPGDICGQMEG